MNDRFQALRPPSLRRCAAVANILNRPRIASCAGLVLAVLIGLAFPAAAQTRGTFIGGASRNLFEARGVTVDVTAATVTEARERALTQGRVAALRQMVEHLATPEEANKLPELQSNQVIEMVREFSLANERTSAVRYMADMTVSFDPEAVRRLLRAAKIPFNEFISKPMVVLPVYVEGGKAVLWEETNPWREAWLRVKDRSALVPLLMPAGDAEDAKLTAAQVLAKDKDALEEIAARYDAAGVIIAKATAGSGESLSLVFAEQRGTVTLPDTGVAFAPQAGQSREDVLTAAAKEVADAVADGWKKNNRVDVSVSSQITALAMVQDLKDWIRLRRKLRDIPLVQHVDVQAMTRDRAQVTLRYAGDQARLESALAQQSLTLSQQGGIWIIATAVRRAAPAAETAQ